MDTTTSMEQRFWNALRASDTDIIAARRCFVEMTDSGAYSDEYLALHEAALVYRENARRKADALRLLMDRIIDAECNDALLVARALVEASRLAFMINATQAMKRIQRKANEVFEAHESDETVIVWRAGVELNVGIHLYANRRYGDALTWFQAMRLHLIDRPGYGCWGAQVNAYIAMCLVRLNNVASAKSVLAEADADAYPFTEHVRLLAHGILAVHECRHSEARVFLREALRIARQPSTCDGWHASLALLSLIGVYKALGNEDALEMVCDTLRCAVNDGMPHVLDDMVEAMRSE